MIRIIIIGLLSLCLHSGLMAQVNIQEDAPIDMMMRRFAEANKKKTTVDGWRIQIMAKTDRLAIERAKEDFLIAFPGIDADWTHSKPYYRLRAGAFKTKLEAIRLIQELKKEYPGAFPVKDKINKQELIAFL